MSYATVNFIVIPHVATLSETSIDLPGSFLHYQYNHPVNTCNILLTCLQIDHWFPDWYLFRILIVFVNVIKRRLKVSENIKQQRQQQQQ